MHFQLTRGAPRMAKQHIEIRQTFNAPVEKVFPVLTDHETFGDLIGTNFKRVVDSPDEDKNGVGSVRRIRSFPVPAFEETVVTYVPNELMEYVVSKGSPIKNHFGRMRFTGSQAATDLFYTIDFEPKLPFFFLGPLLKRAIERPVRRAIEQFAARFDAPASL